MRRRPRNQGQSFPFIIIAERHGVEIGRHEVLARHEVEAMAYGPFELASAIEIDAFDPALGFRAFRKGQPEPQWQGSYSGSSPASELARSMRMRLSGK
jgi:hypothetical protein